MSDSKQASNGYRVFPVFLAFLVMGFGDAVGPFVALARQQFHLSNFVAQLIPFTGFMMFGILSIPVGLYQDRKGKKLVLQAGVAVMLAGMVAPALLGLTTFPAFLITVLLLGAGATILQVAGNPMMRDVSPAGKYARNLSLGQFVKAIGSLSGPLIPVLAARFFGATWQAMFPIYAALLLITLGTTVALRTTEQHSDDNAASFSSCLALLKDRYVAGMAGAIFLYVGAEVCVSSSIPLFLKDRFSVDISTTGLLGTGLFFLALTVGRFGGGIILNWLSPTKFFVATCVVSFVGLIGIFVPNSAVATSAFFLVGLGFANVFPLVFSITIDRMPQQGNAVSGLMITAIVGGAVLPPLMGLSADLLHSTELSFIVPVLAVAYICATAFRNMRTSLDVNGRESQTQAASLIDQG